MNIFNVVLTNEDNDGNNQPVDEPSITDLQIKQLEALIPKCSEKARGAFSKLYPDIAAIPRSAFDTVLNQLTTSAQKNAQAQEGDV